MNKLLQNMISAGAVSDKLLPNLYGKNGSDNTRIARPVFTLNKKELDNNRRLSAENTLKEKRKNVYKTIKPSDYDNVENYVRYAFNNQRDEYDDARSEEGFRMYLGLEKDPQYFRESKYKPTINADVNSKYYSVDRQLEQDIFNSFKDVVKNKKTYQVSEYDVDSDFSDEPNAFWEGNKQMVKLSPNDDNIITGRPMVSRARVLGNFGVSKGTDKKGDYLSYYDQYDFPNILQNEMQGNPYKIYGRIYYKDQKQNGGPILDPRGQWAHPGQITRIPSNQITMEGVPYPVLGIGNNGQQQMMYPGQDYNFNNADYVDEYPMLQDGGEKRSFLETASQFIPYYEDYLDIKDILQGVFTGNKSQMNQGVIGLGQPFAGKALTSTLDYFTEKNLGKKTADKLSNKREGIVNMSNLERQELFKRYGFGGYDKWVKDGKPELDYYNYNYEDGGEMIHRADGSYSRRGLWDNIRANRGSGKKPTLEMLKQERRINSKQNGGETLADKIISANANKDVAKEYYANQERLIKSTKSPLNIPTSLNHTTDNSNIKSKGLILRNDSIENVSGNNFLKTNRGGLNIDSVMNTFASVSNNSKLNYYSKDDGKMKIFDKYPIIKNKKSKFNFSLIN
jgi:hypothetical protein